MASRFQLVDSEESEYSEEESDERQRIEDRRQLFDDSSDDEEETRVVKTQKEKRWEVLQGHCAKIKNKLKILDYIGTVNEYEELLKQIAKSENVIHAEGLPVFCARTFVRLEDAVNSVTKEAQKKMNTNNAKSFTKLKIQLKKNRPQFEEKINAFRANPVESEVSDQESVEAEDEKKVKKNNKKSESEEDEEEEGSEEEEDDSEEWGEGSDDDDDDSEIDEEREEERSRPVDPQERRRFWEIKDKPEKKIEKKEGEDASKKPKGPIKEGKKIDVKEVKKEVFTTESISAKIKEIQEKRVKKVTNSELFIPELKTLLTHCKDSELTLQILNLLVLIEFETAKDTISVIMPRETWLSIVDYMHQILTIYIPKYPVPEDLDETRRSIILSMSLRVERLSSELTKAFKSLDTKSVQYSQRLLDNIQLSKLIKHAYSFLESIKDSQKLSKLAELSIYQIHYIHDDILQEMREKSKNHSSDLFYSVTDSQKYVNDMAEIVFNHGEPTQKIITALMVSFHHALHGRYEQAKQLFLQANTSTCQSDLAVQVFTNRVVVQIGLAAFYNGKVAEAFNSLNEIVSTHRLKELLAQTLSANKDKSTIHEDRKRAIPYHMHINTDVVETVYFICAMILDVPKMVMNPEDPDKFTLSKYFKKLLSFHERQASSGLTESFREFIIMATQKLRRGYWKEAFDILENLYTWKHVPRAQSVKLLMLENMKKAGMITFLVTYGDLYENFSKQQLSEKFGLEKKEVVKVINPLILNGEIMAFWDGDFLNLKVPAGNKNDFGSDKKDKIAAGEHNELINDFAQFLQKFGDGFKVVANKKKKTLRRLA
jgi:translation initiation factor 3 subunit C